MLIIINQDYYKISTKIIPEISHPIKEKFVYHTSYKIDYTIIIFAIIYFILNVINLLCLIFRFNDENFRCTILNHSKLNIFLKNIICHCHLKDKETLKKAIDELNELVNPRKENPRINVRNILDSENNLENNQNAIYTYYRRENSSEENQRINKQKSLKDCFQEIKEINKELDESSENDLNNSNTENRDQSKNYDEIFKEYLYKNKIYKLLEELFEKITAPARINNNN